MSGKPNSTIYRGKTTRAIEVMLKNEVDGVKKVEVL